MKQKDRATLKENPLYSAVQPFMEKLQANRRPILAGLFFLVVLIFVGSLYFEKVSSRSVSAFEEYQKAIQTTGTTEEKITKLEGFLSGKAKNTDLEVKANLDLSELYVESQQWEKAKQALQRVLDGNPSKSEQVIAHLRLGEVLTFTASASKDNVADLDKAIEHFNKARQYAALDEMKTEIEKNIEGVKKQKEKLAAAPKPALEKPATETKPAPAKSPATK